MSSLERRPWWPWLSTACRLVLAGVLGVAGAIKIPDPTESVRAVRAYQVLPEAIVPTVGYALPLLEVILAVLLILGFATRFAAAAAGLLMVVFIVGIGQAAARGLTIDCGCFGGGGQVAANQTRYTEEILRDIGLLLAAAFLLRWPASRWALDTHQKENPP